jgi:WD40 repeat protein/DNA-directed RNA polymerase subunit RPC12/RpoP
LSVLPVERRPVTACAFVPDRAEWACGSMEGMFGIWDAVSHHPRVRFQAHTRPITSICYTPDGEHLATASWDQQVIIWAANQEQEPEASMRHDDLVSGCGFTSSGEQLLSWSHDGTFRVWETSTGSSRGRYRGHIDRVTAAALSPDGRWIVTAGREGMVNLWDLEAKAKAASSGYPEEVHACFFLFDVTKLLLVSTNGRVTVVGLPEFDVYSDISTRVRVQCAALAPSGRELTIGGEEGDLHLFQLDGFEPDTLQVSLSTQGQKKPSVLSRILSKRRTELVYRYICPACRHPFEGTLSEEPIITCANCGRRLHPYRQLSQMPQTLAESCDQGALSSPQL